MASYNRVMLLGNCTRDPEVRYTPNGTAVCDVGIAVNERKKNQAGTWVEDPQFFDVVVFGKTAEFAGEYLKKGSPFFVEGKLKYEQWEDKKSGEKRSKVKVVCDRLQLLGSNRGGGQGGSQGRAQGGGRGRQERPQDEPEDNYGPPDDGTPF